MIYVGDKYIDEINVGNKEVYEIYSYKTKVYPETLQVNVIFILNVSGNVSINGYIPIINEDNTMFTFIIPYNTGYSAVITSDHYITQTINNTTKYKDITHNINLEWQVISATYTLTIPYKIENYINRTTNDIEIWLNTEKLGNFNNGIFVYTIADDRNAPEFLLITLKCNSVIFIGNKYSVSIPTSSYINNKNRFKVQFSNNTPNIGDSIKLIKTYLEVGKRNLIADNVDTYGTIKININSTTTIVFNYEITNSSSVIVNNINLLNIANNIDYARIIIPEDGKLENYKIEIDNNTTTSNRVITINIECLLKPYNYFDNLYPDNYIGITTVNIIQLAGNKIYDNANTIINTNVDKTLIPSTGGEVNIINNNVTIPYKWNNIGNILYDNFDVSSITINGDATIIGNKIIFTNNESISSRSATLTIKYGDLIKTITIIQSAGSKVYTAWSDWEVLLSLSTTYIVASGGTSDIVSFTSRSRSWSWNGIGDSTNETETARPTITLSNDEFKFSNDIVSIDNNKSINTRSTNVIATQGSTIKELTITQAEGVKIYKPNSCSVRLDEYNDIIAAQGATIKINAVGTKIITYTWNNVGEIYNENKIIDCIVTTNGAAIIDDNDNLTYDNNKSTLSRTTIVTALVEVDKLEATKSINVVQAAGNKIYSEWTNWNINFNLASLNIAATGGSYTISPTANKTRTWTWNGIGTITTDTETGIPTLSKVNGDFTLVNKTITILNNKSTNTLYFTIRGTIDEIIKDFQFTQSAGSKTYSEYSDWIVSFEASAYNIAANGGLITLSYIGRRSRTWQWNGIEDIYNEFDSTTPIISKISGDIILSNNTASYSNNESANTKTSKLRAAVSNIYKDIDITQSAGNKVYTEWREHTFIYTISNQIVAKEGNSYRLGGHYTRTRSYTWNNIGNSYNESQNNIPITGWSCDTPNILVINNNTADANIGYNKTLYTRTIKIYGWAESVMAAKSITFTQDKGIIYNASYDYAAFGYKYQGDILFQNYNDYIKFRTLISNPLTSITINVYATRSSFSNRFICKYITSLKIAWEGIGQTLEPAILIDVPVKSYAIGQFDLATDFGLYYTCNSNYANTFNQIINISENNIEGDKIVKFNPTLQSVSYNGTIACVLCMLKKSTSYISNPILKNVSFINFRYYNNIINYTYIDFKIDSNKNIYIKFKDNVTNLQQVGVDISFCDVDNLNSKTITLNNINVSSNTWINLGVIDTGQSTYFNSIRMNDYSTIIAAYNNWHKPINSTGYGYDYVS